MYSVTGGVVWGRSTCYAVEVWHDADTSLAMDTRAVDCTTTPALDIPGPNPCLLLRRANDLVVSDTAVPSTIPAGHALLAIKAVGICGSDIHYLTHGSIGPYVVQAPMIMGHESAGLVLGVGAGVQALAVNDRVAIEPGIGCGHCDQCRTGHYNLCPGMRFFATPPVHGSFCRYVTHPAHLCFKLPESLSYEHGALCEPMSVAVHAANRAKLRPGQRVAVLGAGPIGLMTAMVARAYGAAFLVITDINDDRLTKATELHNETVTLNVTGCDAQTIIERVKTQYDAMDVVFDCVGSSLTANTALGITSSGGCIVSIGLTEARQSLNVSEIAMREIDLLGIFRYRHTYPVCLALMASRNFLPELLITHRIAASEGTGSEYRLRQGAILDGIDIAKTGRGGAIKVMFLL